ncbi:MAG: AraC-like DNA-binding protein [Oceanospirillaceae bacterium]|jgi:AraC-like DNA-binding protein
MFFSSFSSIEEYRDSFKYLDAELIQLSKGFFDSDISTFVHSSIVLDRRVTQASHMHHCTIGLGAINFVFINSFNKLNINGIHISKDNQIVVAEGEELTAIVHGKLDISTVSLPIDELINSIPLSFMTSGSIDAHAIRNSMFSPHNKGEVHLLINKYIDYLKLHPNPSDQLIFDMIDNISFQLIKYVESSQETKAPKKSKLSTQELNHIHDLIANTEVLSLKALQSVCHCSPRTFNNLITKNFNSTPNQLISAIRLNKINRYLGEYSADRKSIKHICEKFGVHSPFRLSKSYKEFFGKSILDSIKEKRKKGVAIAVFFWSNQLEKCLGNVYISSDCCWIAVTCCLKSC